MKTGYLVLFMLLLRTSSVLPCLLMANTCQGIAVVSPSNENLQYKSFIKHYSVVPTRQRFNFSTCFDSQTSANVEIYEWVVPNQTRWIGSVVLNDLISLPWEKLVITVTLAHNVTHYPGCTSDHCGHDCIVTRLQVSVVGTGQGASAEFDLTDGRAFVNRNKQRESWVEREWDWVERNYEELDWERVQSHAYDPVASPRDRELCLPPSPLFLLSSTWSIWNALYASFGTPLNGEESSRVNHSAKRHTLLLSTTALTDDWVKVKQSTAANDATVSGGVLNAVVVKRLAVVRREEQCTRQNFEAVYRRDLL